MTDLCEAELRHSRYYASVLRDASNLYKRGGEQVREALELFEINITNIRNGQAWSESHTDEGSAAAICSRYADAGGYLLRLRLHPRDRIRWLEGAVAAARQLQDKKAEGVHTGNLANAHLNVGETDRARDLYQWRLAIATELDDSDAEEKILGNLASVQLALGENNKAIELLERRLAFTRRSKDRRGEGHALGNLGVAYNRLGDFARAIEFLKEDLAICRDIGDKKGEGAALANLAIAYRKLGESERAIDLYNRALILARTIGDRRLEGHSLFNISLSLNDLGRTTEATDHAVAALEILSQEEDPEAGSVQRQVDRWKERGNRDVNAHS